MRSSVLLSLLLVAAVHAAAPFNTSILSQLLDPPLNATLVKETVVHIQVHPAEQEEIDLAGVYLHQVSSGLQDWTSRIYQFLRDIIGGGAPRMTPSTDRRKLYVI